VHKPPSCRSDPWQSLRSRTSARIALGRCGDSLPTQAWLDFKATHATARDAVWLPFDTDDLIHQLAEAGLETITVQSQARDRAHYLQRPDLGRRLDADACDRLLARQGPYDLAICISDGLSALAVGRHAGPVTTQLIKGLANANWRIAPIVIARYGRVALQDEIGQILGAKLVVILIGERPGLGSPDSLGAYLVHEPRSGRTDAERNCVSNIRPQGLPYSAAVATLIYLLTRARAEAISGVRLKDERNLGSGLTLTRDNAITP
jgi:ethanolamine ammonia-lyase small subunit